MALNFADRYAVRRIIVDRCTAIVANYALYILGEDGNTANHTNRLGWAREAIRAPASVGDSVSYHVLNQPDYISDGSSISDTTLQGVVETAINTHYITPAA